MEMSLKGSKKGFTLIELMIVVAIIGILAAVAIPKFADLINKSKEGSTKGSLGAIRSAVTVYYGDNEGIYPIGNLDTVLAPKYIKEIPGTKTPPYHTNEPSTLQYVNFTSGTITDQGGWAYANNSAYTAWGTIIVGCSHNDSKGTVWTSY